MAGIHTITAKAFNALPREALPGLRCDEYDGTNDAVTSADCWHAVRLAARGDVEQLLIITKEWGRIVATSTRWSGARQVVA